MATPTCIGAFLLMFNNGDWESGNLSPTSTTSWTQEPFPSPGPNGVIALASTIFTLSLTNGWVLDNNAVLWQRKDQSTFTQIVQGDLSPNSFDFYAQPGGAFAGVTVIGNVGVPAGSQQQSYVFQTEQAFTGPLVASFPNPPFATGLTFMRFWADERKLATLPPNLLSGFFMAQLRDAQNVDHLYTSADMRNWSPLTLPSTPV